MLFGLGCLFRPAHRMMCPPDVMESFSHALHEATIHTFDEGNKTTPQEKRGSRPTRLPSTGARPLDRSRKRQLLPSDLRQADCNLVGAQLPGSLNYFVPGIPDA